MADLRTRLGPLLLPLMVIVITIAVTAPLILIAQANPFEAYYAFLIEPFTSRVTATEILVKAAPLILTGTAVAVAFSAGYYSVGAEGQLYAGAIAAAWLGPMLTGVPAPAAIAIMVLGGAAAGAAWALLPAVLKTRLGVDEVVTTLLLNSVMLFLVSALLNGPWRNPVTQWPQSPRIAASAEFFPLVEGTRVHIGFAIALACLALFGLMIRYTGLGLRMRAIGKGREAARFLGINIPRTTLIAALLSGAIAGLAGVGEVAGIHGHLIEAISPGYGYSGIVVATLGGLNSWGIGLAALFLGLINSGAQEVSRSLNVPVYLADVVQATLLIATLIALYFRRPNR